MGNDLVQQQLVFTMEKLKDVSQEIRVFLNDTTLKELSDQGKEVDIKDYEDILDQFRRILVFFDEGRESGSLLLRSEVFRKSAAEKTLYWVFHQCVEEFFHPKLDVWYEDSRAAYTGKNAIKFRVPVPEKMKELVKSIEGPLQEVREELEYYETDYRTKMRQRGNE
ncbi:MULTISPECIES: DUF3907 family protein [Bacillaceae]|uniref:YpuI family protein n=1 Tax=Evansella alkalicola TaxID=745819 RepID=A0ABS6JZK4_9BACI|nr:MULTISPECIES: DUF3907 family protein [Bacillaceae]MBU9724014.1 YpuI family protein [Bacillus alkalicola]